MANEVNNIIYKVEVDTKSGKVNIDGITHGFEQADKSFTKLKNNVTKSANTMNKAMDKTAQASGSAASATMELSRVISDAPYGIRGMANNLTQMVSQMGYATKSAGSFKGAIKDMWASLMGPLGIVFAITTAISALDFFAGSTKKAESSAGDYKSELEKLRGELDNMADSQINVNDTIEDYIRLQNQKTKLDATQLEISEKLEDIEKDLVYLREDNAKKQKALLKDLSVAQYEALSDEEKIAFRRDNLTTDFNKKFEQLKENIAEEIQLEKDKRVQIKLSLDAQDAYNKNKDDSTKAEEGTIIALQNQIKELEKEQKQVSKTAKEYKDYADQIKIVQDKIDAITGKDGKKGKRDKVSPLIDANDLVKDQAKLIKIQEHYEKKSLGLMEISNVNRLMLQKGLAIRSLRGLKGDHTQALDAISKFYDDAIEIERTKQLEGSVDLTKPPVSISAMTPEQMKAEKKRRIEAMIETSQEIADVAVGLLTSSYDREIAIEQNKTNAMNNELRERLNNENLSAGERKRIQLEIARNDEAMRVKKEKLEKKAFNLQKTANIANALIQTYQGAQSAYVNTLANPMNKLDLSAGLVRAKVNAGIAGAMGLANVAMIAKQKFQSTAGATTPAGALGGGGADGGNNRDFNFNLAGRSSNNQLAETLQSNFDTPLRAYVVGRDVTNQQQLDEEIDSQTSFG